MGFLRVCLPGILSGWQRMMWLNALGAAAQGGNADVGPGNAAKGPWKRL